MNCSDAQALMANSDVQGSSTLSEVLSPSYRPQASAANVSNQMGPYATAGGVSKQMPYANAKATTTPQAGTFDAAGVTTPQTGPFATAGTTTQQAGTIATAGTATQQTAPFATAGQFLPITSTTQPAPMTINSLQYLNGALRTQIGRKVTVDFLIGTNTLVDKTGTLLGVGANYIIINEIETDDLLFCDYYTIKFVKVYG